MKNETKDRLKRAATVAAMLTPPWNVFWWTVGGITLYVRGGKKWNGSGDSAVATVFGAPVSLPRLPVVLVQEQIARIKFERRQAKYREAADWIAAHLRRYGMTVTDSGAAKNGAWVVATVDPMQEAAYATVYAQAVQHFAPSGLTADEICANVEPLHPLDEEWARRHGIGVSAEKVYTAPCDDCSVQDVIGWRFGASRLRSIALQRQMHHTITLADGTMRVVNGHLCHPCLDRLEWTNVCTAHDTAAPIKDAQKKK